MYEEIEKELHETIQEELKVKNKTRELTREFHKQQQDHLRPLIGMCFIGSNISGQLFRIIGVPEETETKTGSVFNPYQLPVLAITTNEESPIEFDTIYSKAAFSEDPVKQIRREYEEISNTVFEQTLDEICRQLKQIGRKS